MWLRQADLNGVDGCPEYTAAGIEALPFAESPSTLIGLRLILNSGSTEFWSSLDNRFEMERSMAGRSLVLIAVLIGFLAVQASAQEQRRGDVVQGQRARAKVGLALSGGGVKGFAHVGALRIIESMGIPVDVVAGTSMGSFVGGLYAMGYTVDQLDSLLRAEDWSVLFEEESPRRQQPLEYRLAEEGLLLSLPVRGGQVELPRGLVAGHRISQMLSRLYFPASRTRDFRQLPIPFGAVAADLADGEAVLLTSGSLAAAVRASISLPSVFDPVVIDGRTLIDGGVTRNLPAQDALALGADAVICVDVGEPVLPVDSLRSLVSIMVQAVGFRMLESNRVQQRLCDVLIAPDVKGVGAFQFERSAEIIARGEEAATRARSRLAALRDSLFKSPSDAITRIPSRIRGPDSVLVRDMLVRGVSSPNEAVIRRSMRLTLPDYLSQSELQEAVDRAYRSQRFARVTYRFDATGRDTVGSSPATLVVSAVERSGDRISLGLRYDSDYRASILMRVTLSNLLGYNTRLVGSIRLGEILRAEAALATPMGLGVPARIFANMDASRMPIDLFTDGQRTSNLVAHTLETSIRVGGFIRRHVALAVGIRGELYDIDPRIAQSPGISFDFLDERSGLVFGEALMHLDTFDRVSFPSRGVKVSVRSSATVAPLSSDEFGQHKVDAEARAPLGNRVSLSGRIALGRTVGGSTPLHYRFYAGGTFPFETLAGRHFPLFGRDLQEVAGPNMRAAWGGLQVELRRDLFVGALWNAASATDRWVGDVDPDDFQTGVGISAGIRSAVGPIQAIVTAADLDGPYQLHVSVGHAF